MSEERKADSLVGLPVLETACEWCAGKGWRLECGNREKCEMCDGAGYQPTPLGDKVLSLLRHNFCSLFDQLIRK